MLMKFDRLLLRKVLWQVAALRMAFFFVAPLYWVLSNSLRPVGMPPPHTLEWLPQPLAWSNYTKIFHIVPLLTPGRQFNPGQHHWRSHHVAHGFRAGVFALAQMPAGVRRWLVGLAVALLMIPTTAVGCRVMSSSVGWASPIPIWRCSPLPSWGRSHYTY